MYKSPNADAVLRAADETEYMALNETEYLINFFAEGATKAYWRLWAPLGEPMVCTVEAWAEMQREYFQWMRQGSVVRS